MPLRLNAEERKTLSPEFSRQSSTVAEDDVDAAAAAPRMSRGEALKKKQHEKEAIIAKYQERLASRSAQSIRVWLREQVCMCVVALLNCGQGIHCSCVAVMPRVCDACH